MRERLAHRCALGLLLLLFFQLITSATIKSPTFDEVLHAMRGHVFLATGDWRMQVNLHPPLVHLITGIFMWPVFPHVNPPNLESWIFSTSPFELALEVVKQMGYPSGFIPVFFSRVVAMGFTLLLGALLFRWAKSWYGSYAGVLALSIYVFAPNSLAHGRLITTDMPVAMTFFLATYALQRLVAHPADKTLLLAGLSLGLALGAKVSAVILMPIFAAMIMPWLQNPDWLRGLDHGKGHRFLHLPLVWLLGTTVVAMFTLWAIYGFEMGPYAEGWPSLPLPTYVITLANTFFSFYRSDVAPPAFLMGRRSLSGWWYYFPATFLIKNPLPIIIASLVGFGWVLYERRWWQLWFGAIWPIVYFGMAMLNSWNFGYRYILPVEPFVILWAAASFGFFRSRWILRILGVLLFIWLAVGTIRIHPDYLAYFNEVVGGPTRGHLYLSDSNLDWGQDLIQLRQYLEEADIGEVYLSYFGSVDPAAYGIEYIALPSFRPLKDEQQIPIYAPEPGVYVISTSNLSGQGFSNVSLFDWFRRREPTARIGYSIHVYEVPSLSDSIPRRVGICSDFSDAIMPEEAQLTAGFGEPEVHIARITCNDIEDLEHLGWVIVPVTEEEILRRLDRAQWELVFQQADFEGVPLFNVYLRPEDL